MRKIRKPAVAGAFYPGDRDELTSMIEEMMDAAADVAVKGSVKGIVVPHAGYVYSGVVAAAGFKLLKNLDKKKKWKVLLLGPSHFVGFYGAAAPEAQGWETPLGVVPVKNILDEIGESEIIQARDDVFEEEHSLEVEVPFLQTVMNDWTLYPLCLGEVNPQNLAKEIKDFAAKDDVIIVVSSDLSHYYSYDDARVLDKNANKLIPIDAISEVRDRVEACGIKGILTLMHLSDMLGLKGHFVDYKNSGDTAGDKTRVVGYGCYAFSHEAKLSDPLS
jgi:AmmeMemoRadiSam system protein B